MTTSQAQAIFKPYQAARPELNRHEVKVPASYLCDLATKTADIAYGVESLLEMLEISAIERDSDERAPLLNPYHEGRLIRLAIVSLNMLAESADQTMEAAYKQHTPQGRAGK